MARTSVQDILQRVSSQTGIPYGVFHTFGSIESSLNPRARTGSYKGLFQLSNEEFRKNGGRGSIFDAEANAKAFANLVKQNASYFKNNTGKNPTVADLYLMHQQGTAGYLQHVKNPDQPAWVSMWQTGEGQQKGKAWAKKAIWGNVPARDKKRFGSVNNVTSADFTNMWKARVVQTSQVASAEDVNAAGTVPAPESRSKALGTPPGGQKIIYDRMSDNVAPPMPERKLAEAPTTPPLRSSPANAAAPAANGFFTPEKLQDVFGGTFGDLYSRPDVTPQAFNMPQANGGATSSPTPSDGVSNQNTGAAPVASTHLLADVMGLPKPPIFRDWFQSLFR